MFHVVNTRAELIAAVRASAQPTYELAKRNPVLIQFGRATYTFKEGIHEQRAIQIEKNIRKMLPARNTLN